MNNLVEKIQSLIHHPENNDAFIIASLELRAIAIQTITQDLFKDYFPETKLSQWCNEVYNIAREDVKIISYSYIDDANLSESEWLNNSSAKSESHEKITDLYDTILNKIQNETHRVAIKNELENNFLAKITKHIQKHIQAQLDTLENLETTFGSLDTVKKAIENVANTVQTKVSKPQVPSVLEVIGLLTETVLPENYARRRRKQQLLAATENYQTQLKEIIQTELVCCSESGYSYDPNFMPIDMPIEMYFSAYQEKSRAPFLTVSEVLNPPNETIKSHTEILRSENTNLNDAIQKYHALSSLNEKLNSKAPVIQQLSDFRNAFKECRKIITQQQDSAGLVFLKIVASIFSLGLAVAFGIWKTEGQRVETRIDNIMGVNELGAI